MLEVKFYVRFGNKDEFSAMVNSKNTDDGVEYAKSLNILSIITLAEKGSLIVNNGKVINIEAEPVSKVVDTTGAGDLYAAGFLYGLTNKKSYEERSRFSFWKKIFDKRVVDIKHCNKNN